MKNEMIAKVLKKYRKNNKLTVNEVAELLNERSLTVATKTIYGWESGQAQPDADTLLVLCEIYNIDDILGTFGYSNKKQFHITNHERELIEKIEQEGNLTKFPDLSHHRAYRSVHGGSINLTSNTPFGVVI